MDRLDEIEQEEIISTYEEEKYPSLVVRYQSFFADTLIIIVMMFISGYSLEYIESPPEWIRIALFFGIWAIYEPLCTSIGCTFGNYIMKIRVREHENERKKLTFPLAFVRYLFKMLLGIISFITISSSNERRGIHDFIVGSVVVNLKYLKRLDRG
jgi:uncharacterized RDD family membrane protein YckC